MSDGSKRTAGAFQRTGPFRLQFLLESLHDLREHLREVGSDLVVKVGRPEVMLPELAQKYDCSTLYCSKEYTYEEIQMEKALEEQLSVAYFHNSPMIHPEDLPFSIEKLPKVFTDFRKKVEKYSQVRSPYASPKSIASPELEGKRYSYA